MKVTIGMRVRGEVSEGTVVAMSRYWCIYRIGRMEREEYGGDECAEPWSCIEVVSNGPATFPVSSVDSKEIP